MWRTKIVNDLIHIHLPVGYFPNNFINCGVLIIAVRNKKHFCFGVNFFVPVCMEEK